jgi:DNA topoisomerase II
MAQDFVGSNNINLLVPSGQFGTRLAGGADAASPRYIFTYLSPITRLLFREEDDLLLEYLEDDGQVIEPTSFYPILPLLLINGTQGIGTGWSTCIPPHDPRSVLDYIKAKIRGDANLPEIRPYVRGFQGSIQPTEDGKGYVSFGRARRLDKRTVMIDELPVGAWTNAYKQKLINMRDKGSIADFVEDHTTTKVSFKVKAKPIQISRMEKTGFESSFKLSTKMSLQNMNAFDINGNIQKFFSVEELADAFFDARLALYKDRKSVLQSEMEYAANVMRNKARFIQSVVVGKIDLLSGKSTKEQTTMKLRDLGFASEQDLQTIRENNTVRRRRDRHAKIAVREAVSVEGITSGFDYLLRMPLGSLTAERIEDLEGDALKKENDLQVIKAKKPEDLWEDDLEELSPHL